MTNILESSVGRMPAAEASVYRQAVQEFDRLWETGGSRRQPQRMQALLLLIEEFENTSHAHPVEGTNNAKHYA